MSDLQIPPDVTDWVRAVFRDCNVRLTTKLCNNPNTPEPSLDLSWIEHLTQVASPIRLGSAWTVKIQTHYLGGMRHFMGRWEIADIGVLLFIRQGGGVTRSKVALLQSKRLYPTNMGVSEEAVVDYEIGFARLADPEDLAAGIAFDAQYTFDSACKYGALISKSDQVKAIAAYQRDTGLPIYYQFYNPWRLPFRVRIPVDRFRRPRGEPKLGVRIMPSAAVHEAFAKRQAGHRPSITELTDAYGGGWPLESFIADELLGCREGHPFASVEDDAIQSLFYRRSGPIAAAIAITIEAPENWEPQIG